MIKSYLVIKSYKGRRKEKKVWDKIKWIFKKERINGWILKVTNGGEDKKIWRKRKENKINIV